MRWSDWLVQVDKMVQAWRGQQLMSGAQRAVCGQLGWTSWMDPGTATGLASVVYLVPPNPEEVDGLLNAMRPATGMTSTRISYVGELVGQWSKILATVRVENVPGGLLQTYDATGAIVLTYYAETMGGSENEMVRRAMSRVRGLGAVWSGHHDWDHEGGRVDSASRDAGLGPAGIGAETFTLLKVNRDHDYLSPLRIRSAFSYALEDEFGVEMKSNSASDMKDSFGSLQLKRLGMWVPGADHGRDALGHCLFGIRKN